MRLSLILTLALLASGCVLVPAGGHGHHKAGGDTVLVCHKGKQTKELPREAAKAHIDHGDRYGPC